MVYNNNGADAAKQLSWLKAIAGKRGAFSSEPPMNVTLDGNAFKAVVSGGDPMTVRSNFKDEEVMRNRATLFIFANDVPKFNPCDDAVLDRIGGVIEMHVEFKTEPDPSNPRQKRRNDAIKSAFDAPEMQDAFVAHLLAAYRVFLRVGHVVPHQVKHSMSEWIEFEGSLKSMLEEKYSITGNAEDFVPYKDLRKFLVEERRLAYSDTKLGKELTALGIPVHKKKVGRVTVKGRVGLVEL